MSWPALQSTKESQLEAPKLQGGARKRKAPFGNECSGMWNVFFSLSFGRAKLDYCPLDYTQIFRALQTTYSRRGIKQTQAVRCIPFFLVPFLQSEQTHIFTSSFYLPHQHTPRPTRHPSNQPTLHSLHAHVRYCIFSPPPMPCLLSETFKKIEKHAI